MSIFLLIVAAYVAVFFLTFIVCSRYDANVGWVTFTAVLWPLTIIFYSSVPWFAFWRGVYAALCWLHEQTLVRLHKLVRSGMKG